MLRSPYRWIQVLLLGMVVPAGVLVRARADGALDVADRLQIFVDDALVDARRDVTLVLASPTPAESVLRFDNPWEGPTCDYVTVFQDGSRYRLYYAAHPLGFTGDSQFTCYAESADGIRWEKPTLGLFEFQGSRRNNILWRGEPSHNFSPFVDTNPAAPAAERYKAVGGHEPVGFVSEDGIRWRRFGDAPFFRLDDPVFDHLKVTYWGNDPKQGHAIGDSQNVVFWHGPTRRYVYYFRAWLPSGLEKPAALRTIFRATSADFTTWSTPEPLAFSDPPSRFDQFYTNGILPYPRAPEILVALPMRYAQRPARSPAAPKAGVAETTFMSSRDGLYFRRFMEPLIRPGRDRRDWSKHSLMAAWGILMTRPDEMSIYTLQHYYADTAHLRRSTLRTDGFASLRAPARGGEFTTRPLVFAGNRLLLNVATGAAGDVRVELQDAAGRPLPGYALEDAVPFHGDEIAQAAAWRSGPDVGALAGRPVRLRVDMRDADLYAFRFAAER